MQQQTTTQMSLRPYQSEAVKSVQESWSDGVQKTLLILPTGTGKTVVFCSIGKSVLEHGGRILILAHRAELLDQAADKFERLTGIRPELEKAESTTVGSWCNAVVGSVQSFNPARLDRFDKHDFSHIIIDEAHHTLATSYMRVLDYFSDAKVLGVTATADRGDKRNLGEVYQTVSYEMTLARAIREGWLCKIKALTLPIQMTVKGKSVAGDYTASDCASAIDPYLEDIARQMKEVAGDRKTIVFLPLIATSQRFRDLCLANGLDAREVNGNSEDRAETLEWFHNAGPGSVLANSMLVTEGYDEPSVDCVCVLRPTKVRSLYCLDEQTEILTREGWKRHVEVGEEVAAFDTKTDEIRFMPALASIKRPLDDNEFFCSINGPSTDIRVTNKHRMVYDNKRRKGWKIKTAEQIADMKDGCFIPVSGHGNFKGVMLTDDEIRFIGWVMTDGCIDKANGAIYITQNSTSPAVEAIQKCLENCGLKFGKRIHNAETSFVRHGDNIIWSISKGQPRGTQKHLHGWGILEPYISKDISPLLNDMDERQFDILMEVIHLADGHKQKAEGWTQRSYHITKGNKIFIEKLQCMAIQRGYRASMVEHINSFGNPIWTIHMKKTSRNSIGGTYDDRPQWRKEPHTNENCWCVENDLGTLVTRRNGKVAIVGNCQMVGRGTRLSPGKQDVLLLDFLWMSEKHDLVRPCSLVAKNPDLAARISEIMQEDTQKEAVDLMEAEEKAESTAREEREESLRKELEKQRARKRSLVDPLQYEYSIDKAATQFVPDETQLWQLAPVTNKQKEALEKAGIFPDEITCSGHAAHILDVIQKRRDEGMTTPKQIRCLERFGFVNVGTWRFDQAKKAIDRIAANGWRCTIGLKDRIMEGLRYE